MDLQTSLICVGVFAVSAIGVYLISVFGMREKTYEEAIAEQRQKGEDMFAVKKADSKPSKEKKHKKWLRKPKEKSDRGGEFESELHVGFKPDAEIIPDEKEGEGKKSVKGAKKDEPRSILINKKEKSPPAAPKDEGKAAKKQGSVEGTEAPAKESKPAEKEPSPPKKEEKKAELKEAKPDEPKPEREKKRETSAEKEPQKEKSKEREAKPAEESKPKETKKEEAPVVQAPHAGSPSRKAKKSKIDDEALNSGRLASLIKAAVLSQTEIHSLIETLLNKQQAEAASNTEWLKIGQKMDPMSALRKQLQEKEEMLTEERQRAQTSGTKLKELRAELNTEKSRCSQLERQHQQELQNLRLQLQRAMAQRSEETSSVQKLKDENAQLTLQANQLETQSCSLQVKIDELQGIVGQFEIEKQQMEDRTQVLREDEKSSHERQVRELENQNRTLEGEKEGLLSQLQNTGATHDNLEAEKGRLQKCLEELQEEISALKSSWNESTNLIEDLKQQKHSLEKQASTLQATLSTHDASLKQLNELMEDAKREKSALEKEIGASKSQINDLMEEKGKCDDQILVLKESNESLCMQLSKVTEREEAEGQEGTGDALPRDKTNGHVQLEECDDHKKILLTEHEHVLHEKEDLVRRLTAELKDKTNEVQDLHQQVVDHKETISRITADVEAQKEKNNALREKNWKVMEALNTAEKSLNDSVKKAENWANEKFLDRLKAEQNLHQEVLERIFPAIRIDKSTGYSEWISQFEQHALSSLKEALEVKESDAAEDDLRSKLEAAEESSAKLQAQVHHYKTSLVETEGILKKIQGSVEEEELKWKEKLEVKDQELEKLLQEKKSYEASLEQVQAAEEAAAEMQGKLRELQEKLETEETEKRSLDDRRVEVEKVASGLRDQLKQSEEQLHQCQLTKDEISERSKENEELRKELEKERQSLKELSVQSVKLNGLVKIGQDALRAEQELVKSLESQLEASKVGQVSSTNGPPNDIQITADESRFSGTEACPKPNRSAVDSCAVSGSPAHSTSNLVTSKKAKNKKRVRRRTLSVPLPSELASLDRGAVPPESWDPSIQHSFSTACLHGRFPAEQLFRPLQAAAFYSSPPVARLALSGSLQVISRVSPLANKD